MARRRRWSFFSGPLENRGVLWFDDFHRGEFTVGGRVLFWGMILSGTMLMGGLTTPLVLCFGFCTSALTLAGIMGYFYRPVLKLNRQIISSPSAGEVFSYRVDVENVGKRAARNIVIEERKLPPDLRPVGEPPVIDVLEPGEQTSVVLRLRCISRDVHVLNRLQGGTIFPTGLVKSGRKSRHEDRLVVYPRIDDAGGMEIPYSKNYQPGGIAIASQVGQSTEFLGTRHWRRGDRLRDIHWPSSARTGRLISREFQEEYFVRLGVVLDTEALWASEERRMEQALSLAAGLTAELAEKDYVVDLFVAGDDVHHVQAGRAITQMENILELLACVEPADTLDVGALESVLLPEASRLSTVVFVMMMWNPPRLELIQRLRNEGVAIRVICMKKGWYPKGLDPAEVIDLQRATDSGASLSMMKMSFFKPRTV